MKQINLLPPQKQKHTINLYFFLFARFIFLLLLSVMIFMGITLGGASMLLNESVQQVSLHSSAIDKEFNAVNKNILFVNDELKKIEFVNTERAPWSTRLLLILKEMSPPSITLSGLSVSHDGSTIALQGRAQNRNSLLDLQSRLKKIPFVKDATVPLDNLIPQDNIEFQMTIHVQL